MTPAGGLRDTVAAQLIALSTPGQPLHADSDRRTFVLYAGDVGRQLVQKNIIEMYRAGMSPAEGRTAVITAGPPGAGKTTALKAQVAELDTYRDLDADTIKEYLIGQALNDGIYNDLLELPLADGHPVAPFELAGLVHDESTQLIEEIRRQCLLQSENVVVQATLQWDGHGPRIFSQLAAADYKAVRILAVEADPAVAHEQALQRWWERRGDGETRYEKRDLTRVRESPAEQPVPRIRQHASGVSKLHGAHSPNPPRPLGTHAARGNVPS